MLRHEQQSIRMALATVMHHSIKVHTENGAPRSQTTATRAREGEVHEQHDGPRAQKRPLPGTRPAPPSEVTEPQGAAATGGYVAAGAPLLAVSSLRGADGVDDTAVKFLLRAELKMKEEEEEEEERKLELADEVLDDKLEAEFDALMATGHLTSRQEARLSAVMRERLELIERKKRRRVARKSKKKEEEEASSYLSSSSTVACSQGWFCWLCCTSRYAPFFRRQDQDAGHFGCYGPERQFFFALFVDNGSCVSLRCFGCFLRPCI